MAHILDALTLAYDLLYSAVKKLDSLLDVKNATCREEVIELGNFAYMQKYGDKWRIYFSAQAVVLNPPAYIEIGDNEAYMMLLTFKVILPQKDELKEKVATIAKFCSEFGGSRASQKPQQSGGKAAP